MNRQIHWHLLPVSFQGLLKCVLAVIPSLPSALCLNTRAVFINASRAGHCVAPTPLQWFSCDSLTGPWVPLPSFWCHLIPFVLLFATCCFRCPGIHHTEAICSGNDSVILIHPPCPSLPQLAGLFPASSSCSDLFPLELNLGCTS